MKTLFECRLNYHNEFYSNVIFLKFETKYQLYDIKKLVNRIWCYVFILIYANFFN